MIQIGRFKVSLPNFGFFRLDGGAMFGSVPKNIWAKKIGVDSENCIKLATRSLLIEADGRRILVDVGMGGKWSDKQRAIFGIENASRETLGFSSESVTDVILTHLHFDHAGGISYYDAAGKLKLTYPGARVFVQAENYRVAQNPGLKERASYLPENVNVLKDAKLELTSGQQELLPGLYVHQVNGHTKGQQVIELRDGGKSLLFPTDLIPTSRHLPLPYQMGYDMCAETVIEEKAYFLERAVSEGTIVVFQHDSDTPAVTVGIDDKGHFCVKDRIIT